MTRRDVLGGLALLARGAARAEGAPPIAWGRDEEQAFSESRRTGRPVLIEAWAEWCTACKLMDRNTWSDPEVQRRVRERFVPLRLDLTDETLAGSALERRYGLEGLPTVLACRSPGAGAPRVTGYLRPAELLVFLASVR